MDKTKDFPKRANKSLQDLMTPDAHTAMMREKVGIAEEKYARVNQLKKDKYFQFQEKYRGDLLACINDIFIWKEGESLTDYQADIIDGFKTHDRQAVRGPRSLGKTAMAAWLIITYALTHDGEDWKIPTTASSWRQLEKFLWPEVHKWAGRINWDIVGRPPFDRRIELQTLTLRLQTGRAFAMASDDPETMEGAHADYLLAIFDESKIIPPATWDSFEGALAGAGEGGTQEVKFLAISTPGAPLGRFYDIHKLRNIYDDWHAIHITCEQAIASGRVTREWVDQKRKQWGATSALYKNHVLGEFAATEEDSIIPLEWIEAAMSRGDLWRDGLALGNAKGQLTAVGCDVGLGTKNSDDTVFAETYDGVDVYDLEIQQPGNIDTALMESTGRVTAYINGFNVDVFIDNIGIGAGVLSRLKELGGKIKAKSHAFTASKKAPPKLKDETGQYKFANMRAAMWWIGRELLSPDNPDPISLPRDDVLMGQLTTPEKKIMSNATIAVESKKEIRKRLGTSTDRADAVLQSITGHRLIKKAKAKVYIIGEGYI